MGFMSKFFGPLSQDKFAQEFIAELRATPVVKDVSYDPKEFLLQVSVQGENARTISLSNHYLQYRNLSKQDRREEIRRVLQASLVPLKGSTSSPDEARQNLRPKVWSRATFEFAGLQARLEGKAPPDLPMETLGSHFLTGPVYDTPEAIRTVSNSDLKSWGLSHYEAMEIGRQNLAKVPYQFAGLQGSCYRGVTDDSYDSCRILLDDLICKLEVRGDPIAMIPNRDTLLITGSEDNDGLKVIADQAEQELDGAYPMTVVALRFTGEEWVDWFPPVEHPLHARFRDLEVKTVAGLYAHQQQILSAIYEKEGIGDFVASYSVGQNKENGHLVTYCVWGEGIVSLLPSTHNVAFVRKDTQAPMAMVPLDKVQEVLGDRMTVTDAYPARYRVSDFPTDTELRMLQGAGVE